MQIHVPGASHANQYSANGEVDVWQIFLDYIKKSGVSVFGITDYFSIDGYKTFLSKIKDDESFANFVFFPCIELRLDISVNKNSEQLQCHLIFDYNCGLAGWFQVDRAGDDVKLPLVLTEGSDIAFEGRPASLVQ